jgi:hypothetical protein
MWELRILDTLERTIESKSNDFMNQGISHPQLAIQAATDVAIAQGLRFDRVVVLQDLSNVILRFEPTPVVARVSTMTALYRQGHGWFEREVVIAKYLTAAGAPIIPVSDLLEPGPHSHLGVVLSFWQFVQVLPEPGDPVQIGQALHQCHHTLKHFAGELPLLALITEAQQILSQLIQQSEFSSVDAALLEQVGERSYERLRQLPNQPIHGDSHFGNVLNTLHGNVWTDWEDVFLGPVEWDLASMVASSRIFGTEVDRAEAALRGYGDDFDELALDWCIEARTFVALIWSIILSRPNPSTAQRSRVEQRLNWLRQRNLME